MLDWLAKVAGNNNHYFNAERQELIDLRRRVTRLKLKVCLFSNYINVIEKRLYLLSIFLM